jgi:hypothetical protein
MGKLYCTHAIQRVDEFMSIRGSRFLLQLLQGICNVDDREKVVFMIDPAPIPSANWATALLT